MHENYLNFPTPLSCAQEIRERIALVGTNSLPPEELSHSTVTKITALSRSPLHYVARSYFSELLACFWSHFASSSVQIQSSNCVIPPGTHPQGIRTGRLSSVEEIMRRVAVLLALLALLLPLAAFADGIDIVNRNGTITLLETGITSSQSSLHQFNNIIATPGTLAGPR